MGCTGSSQAKGDKTVNKIQKPKPWKHSEPITKEQLNKMREEFWDTAPHYSGSNEIWDALRAAAGEVVGGADLKGALIILNSAGVINCTADLTTCYDIKGAKYDLPKYVLSDPINLIVGK